MDYRIPLVEWNDRSEVRQVIFEKRVIPQTHTRPFVALIYAAMAVTFSQGLMIPCMASLEALHMTSLMNSLSTSDTLDLCQ